MKFNRSDIYPIIALIFSLGLGSVIPMIRDNDVIRVGWVIIHVVIFVGYLVGIHILGAIEELKLLIPSNTDEENI